MNIVTVLAHPNKKSFNHAIANTTVQALQSAGHRVVLHDLYADQFSPPLLAEEILSLEDESANKESPDPLVNRYCADLTAADGIVIIHPNWWGKPPAIMAGYIDRVFRLGAAYTFPKDDDGSGAQIGLLKAKAAVVFNTSNTPVARERDLFGDPLELIWKRCVFAFCGINNVYRRTFSIVVSSTEQQRREWLDNVREMMGQVFSD